MPLLSGQTRTLLNSQKFHKKVTRYVIGKQY